MSAVTAVDRARDNAKALYVPAPARVWDARSVSAKEAWLSLELEGGKPLGHQPGQFVEVSVLGIGECPISVSSSPTRGNGRFELVVRKVGNVTAALHQLKAGDKVGIRGPFGRGFDVNALKGNDLVFIGGGIGMVPLRSLVQYSLDKRSDFGKIAILYGCKRSDELIFPEERAEWSSRADATYRVTVDAAGPADNWKGNVGVITTLIPGIEMDPSRTYAVVVGPPVMYKFVIRSLKAKNIPDERIVVSLERRMKCGVGKCGHCQMGKYYVCRDGPVFLYSEVKDIKGAI